MINLDEEFEKCIVEAMGCARDNKCNTVDSGKILAEVAKAIAIYKGTQHFVDFYEL